ncbi:Uncharacterised protein [Actinomyces bovis]|uniref:Uncharacterized protein n=1 Tax=Actinomyces bovis TaxID=1658 RepID=A0ABY1VMR3_9ACTO|nr:hypothetical protein [Actinomyces bovis]SPT53399.1 Uncharacterised protein [Actinomyces bovis]VEG52815.1 Uncharacterised protein [Actinomyces israelii]
MTTTKEHTLGVSRLPRWSTWAMTAAVAIAVAAVPLLATVDAKAQETTSPAVSVQTGNGTCDGTCNGTGKGYGPGDGTGNRCGRGDGTGNRVCDGTGAGRGGRHARHGH